MSKYDALGDYLKRQQGDRVPMRFADIEKVTGVKLPPSARKHRPWWSNNAKNSVMTRVWREAGFESGDVDMASSKLAFRRVRGPKSSAATGSEQPFHPLYGMIRRASSASCRAPI